MKLTDYLMLVISYRWSFSPVTGCPMSLQIEKICYKLRKIIELFRMNTCDGRILTTIKSTVYFMFSFQWSSKMIRLITNRWLMLVVYSWVGFGLWSSIGSANANDLATLQGSLEKLQKIVAMQQAEIRRAKNAMFAIGSVQQSFLTESQFQQQMGSGWVLCDGSTAPANSRYIQLNLGSALGYDNPARLPDCKDRFLRSAGGAAAAVLGSAQVAGTNVADVQYSAVSSSSSNTSRTVNSSVSVSGVTGYGNVLRYELWTSAGADTRGNQAIGHGAGGTFDLKTNADYLFREHTHNFSAAGSASGGSWSTSTTTTTTVTAQGDSETRPINISINTFIKVN